LVDDDFDMIAVEVKGVDPKHVANYRYLQRSKEDILMIERLASHNLHSRNLTKRSIMGGYLNLRQADWKLNAEKASGF